MLQRVVLLGVVVVAVVGCEVVTPSNPFDPQTPADQQAKGGLHGVVRLDDGLTPEQRAVQLNAVRVGLVDGAGEAVGDDIVLDDVDGAAGTGVFAFVELVPGRYTPVVSGVPVPPYSAPAIASVDVGAGVDVAVADLVFVDVPGGDDDGPGVVDGAVALAGGGNGQRTVSLFAATTSGVRLVDQAVTGDDGAFSFSGLGLGTYAVVAESADRAPSYRLELVVGGETLEHHFAGDDAIVLQPARLVARPLTSATVRDDDDGFTYVRADAVDLAVFAGVDRAALGVSGIRTGLNRELVEAFAPIPSTTLPVTLPAREGRLSLFVQLEARSTSFAFVTPVFETTVIRDVSPPRVESAALDGRGVDDDGVFLVDDRAFNVTVEASDDVSAINGVASVVSATAPASLDPAVAGSPPGLVRFRLPQAVNVDGPTSVFIVLQDKAGNRSDVIELPILVDTSAPDVDLVVDNAAGGVLRSRVARVSFDESGAANDLPVAMQLRVAGEGFSDVEPAGPGRVVIGDGFVDGDDVTIEARLFDRVGNVADTSVTVSLALRGSIVGRVDADGVPLITGSAAGAVATVSHDGSVVGSDVVSADGVFAIDDVVEGGGYRVDVSLDGYRGGSVADVVVATPVDGTSTRDVGSVFLPLARGDVAVTVVVDGGAPAPGVGVSLSLQGSARRFFVAGSSDVSGVASFSAVPVTRAGESYRVEAVRADDGVSTVASVTVAADVTANVRVSLVEGGDVDVCAAAGPCDAKGFFNDTQVRVRLRGTPAGVDALVVSINGGAATTIPLAVDNLTAVDLGGVADGTVTLSVQPTDNGAPVGAALQTSVVVDRLPPTNATLEVLGDSAAFDRRFTRRSSVDVIARADFGTGAVAPPAVPRVVVALNPPGAPASAAENAGCVHGSACAVALANVEGRQNLHAFACDKAGNCAAVVSGFVIRDTTAPKAGNGVGVDVIAAGSVVNGAVTVLPSARYRLGLRTGSARDAGNAAVVDENGVAVADAFAYRVTTDVSALAVTELRAFNPAPTAGQTRSGLDVVVPALDDVDDVQSVMVEFVDAAGNATVAPFETQLRIDDDRPSFTVDVAAGASALSVPFTITTPVGAEAPARVEVRVDQGAAVSFAVPLVNAQVTLPDVDGAHQIEFAGVDGVGNALIVNKLIVLDRAPPALTSVRCVSAACTDDGTGVVRTRDTAITLQVVAADATSGVARVEAVVNGGAPVSFAAGAAVVLVVSANATATVDLVAVDVAGNRSPLLSRQVAHDSLVPAVTLSFPGLIDPPKTKNANVNVHLDVPAGDAVGVRFGGSLAFVGPVGTFRNDDVVVVPGSDGNHDVCAEVRDAAGNVATSCKSLLLDRTAPVGTIAINNGADTTPFADVTATLTFDADVVAVSVSPVPIACDTAPFVPATTSASITLPFFGPNTVVACLKDGAGNVSAISDGIFREAASQNQLVIAIDAGNATTRSRNVTVSLVRPSSSFTQMKLVEGGTLDCANLSGYEAFNATKVMPPLSAGTARAEGNRIVSACVRDPNSGDTQSAQDSIFVDTFAPNGTVNINAGATVTNSPLLSVGLTNAFSGAGEVVTVALSEASTVVGGDCNGGFEGFSNAKSFTVPGADGSRSVFVCFRDGAGNTREVQASIVLDRVAPTGSIVLNGGAITRNAAQTATLTTDNAVQMKLVTVDNASDVEVFTAFAGSANVVVEDNGAQDGTKTVFLVLRDAAGNESTVSTSIFLDRVAPSSPTVSINNDVAVTNSTSVTLTLSAIGATEMQIGADGTADNEAFVPFAGGALVTIPGGDCAGTTLCKTVQVIFRDAAGNTSTTASDTIRLDTTAPAGTSVTLASATATDTAGFATTTSINATLNYPADATRRKVGEGAVDCGSGGYTDLDGTSPDVVAVTLAPQDGQKTVVVCFQDAAGNATSTTATLTLDRQRPFATIDVDGALTTTTAVNIRVNPASDDVDRVAFVNAAVAPACNAALTYTAVQQPTMPHTLTAGDGDKTVFACFKDVAGNFSLAAVSDVIKLDATPPVVTHSIVRRGDTVVNPAVINTRAAAVRIASLSADAAFLAVDNGTINCDTAAYTALPQPLPALPLELDLTLTAGADGPRTASVCVKDAAGNKSGATGVVDSVDLDVTPPQVTVSLNAGAAFATNASATVTLSATPSNDALRVLQGSDPSVDCAARTFSGGFAALPATVPQALGTTEGERFAVFCFQDAAGNVSKAADSIVLDLTAPTATLAVDNGAAVSLDNVVTANFSNRPTDATLFKVSGSAIADCAAVPDYTAFVDGTNVTLVGGDGVRTVFACFKDAAGNTSPVITDTITQDTQNPAVAIAVASSNAAADPGFTAVLDVDVTLSGISGDVVAFAVGNGVLDCGTAPYLAFGVQPAPSTFATTLRLSGSEGTRTVSACVKDGAGRTNAATGVTTTIELDQTPPAVTMTPPSIVRVSPATVNLSSAPSTDLLKRVFGEDANVDCSRVTYGGAFAALPASVAFALPGTTTGDRDIVGCFRDRAGNFARVVRDVFFDPNAPVLEDGACDDCVAFGGKQFTNKDEIRLDVGIRPGTDDVDFVLAVVTGDTNVAGGFGADRVCTNDTQCRLNAGEICASMPVDNASPPTEALRCVQPLPPGFAFSIELARAAQPVAGLANEGTQGVVLALRDEAGNASVPVVFSVVRDVTAPVVDFVLNVGGLTNQQVVKAENLVITEVDQGVGSLGTFDLATSVTFADAATRTTPIVLTGLRFDVPLTAGDGNKSVFLRARDLAGNLSTARQKDTVLDATPPTLPRLASNTPLLTSETTFTLDPLQLASGDAGGLETPPYRVTSPGASCNPPLFIVDGECGWDGQDPAVITLVEGANAILVNAKDRAGNAGAADAVVITRDTTAPPAPTNLQAIGRSGEVRLSWTASAAADVGGYRLFYGATNTTDKTQMTGNIVGIGPSPVDLGNVTSFTMPISNDLLQFVGIEAYDKVRTGPVSGACAPSTTNANNCSAIVPVPAIAQAVHPIEIGHLNDSFTSIAVQGTRAYALRSGGGFVVIDISDPSNPVLMGSLNSTAVPESGKVVVHGVRAYVGDKTKNGVRVINVGNPLAPVSQGVFLTSSNIFVVDMAVRGSMLWILGNNAATGTAGKLLTTRLESSNRTPDLLTTTTLTATSTLALTSVASAEDKVLVGYGGAGGGYSRIDVPDDGGGGSTPATIGLTRAIAGGVNDIAVYEGRAFFAGPTTLTLENLAGAAALSSTAIGCASVALSPGSIYCADVAAVGERLIVRDVTSEAATSLRGRLVRTVGTQRLFDLSVADGVVYARDDGGDLVAIELARPFIGDALQVATSLTASSGLVSASVMDTWVLGLRTNNLEYQDITRLPSGAFTARQTNSSGSTTTNVRGGVGWGLYVTAGLPFYFHAGSFVGRTNSLACTTGQGGLGGTVETLVRGPDGFTFHDDRMTNWSTGVSVVDGLQCFSTPFSSVPPRQPESFAAVAQQDGMLYWVSTTGVLRVIDARNIDNVHLTSLPQTLSGVPVGALVADGPFLYAASVSGGVRVINISEDAGGATNYVNPTPTFETGALAGVHETMVNVGTMLLAASGAGRNLIQIVNPNPTNPTVLFTDGGTGGGSIDDLVSFGPMVIQADGISTIRILEIKR